MIRLDKVCVRLRHFALENINLEVQSGDYFMLVGPTGSGKTLLLETIAGLHSLKSGAVLLNGEDITELPPEKRQVTLAYQDSALFPHLSVAENILFGIRVQKPQDIDVKKRFEEIVTLVGVEGLLERRPGNLSGGEKQKVALARALIVRPKVLLMDEPLAAVDLETRFELQAELKKIHNELGVTVMHVTHDFEETLSMGKHAAVIGAGRIQQAGTPEQIFRQPESEMVARFTMTRNIFPGHLIGPGIFVSEAMQLTTDSSKNNAKFACIRPEEVTLSVEAASDKSNSFRGVVTRIDDHGQMFHVIVNIPTEVCCVLTRNNFHDMDLKVGVPVSVFLKRQAIHLF